MVALLVLIRGETKKPAEAFGLVWFFSGAPGEIRTPDQLVRSQLLYPTELRVLTGYRLI